MGVSRCPFFDACSSMRVLRCVFVDACSSMRVRRCVFVDARLSILIDVRIHNEQQFDASDDEMLQDFSLPDVELRKFCFVKRRHISFSDGVYWVYGCNCDQTKQEFVNELFSTTEQIHEAELVFSKEKLVSVKPHSKEIGVVGVDRKGFICFSCTFGCHSCSHVEAINSLIDNQSEETPDFLLQMVQRHDVLKKTYPKTYTRCSLSTRRISYGPMASQASIFNGRFIVDTSTLQEDDKLCPDFAYSVCPSCGYDINEATIEWSGSSHRLFTTKMILAVQVPYRRCQNAQCGLIQPYDGCAKGILNMGEFLVGHDVLRDYMLHFLHGHRYPFASHQEIFIEEENFLVFLCGQYPPIILCDATSLGYRRKYSRGLQELPNEANPLSDRGSYTMDKMKSDTREECAKTYRGHPNLLPEICYGFEMMQCQESTNVPFTISQLNCQKEDRAVPAISMRQGPFELKVFFLYLACAESYNASNQPAYDRINTQINEQRNALKTLKSQVSYMNEENFLSHIKLLLFHCNYTLKQEKGF
eukprot:gene3974-18228_t